MEKWSMCERVVFEQTVFDKIESVVGKLKDDGIKAGSQKMYKWDYRNFAAPKIRKVHLGGVGYDISPTRKIRISTCGIHPGYEYDLPRFALEWAEFKSDATMVIADLHVTKDIVMNPDYVEKYLAPLYQIIQEAMASVPGIGTVQAPPPDEYWMLSQYSMYSLRGFKIPLDQTEKAWEFALKYLDVWLEGWKKAEPTTDPEEIKRNEERLQMMSEAYRQKDPGARFWLTIGGEKLAKEMQVFSW